MTANGFAMGVFPVELEPGEPVGLVRAELLLYASHHPRFLDRGLYYSLQFDGEYVEMVDGSRHMPVIPGLEINYPDYRAIIVKALSTLDPGLANLLIDPFLLRLAARAIGSDRQAAVRLTGESAPVVVWPGTEPMSLWRWKEARFAFALVMPLKARASE